MQWDARYEHGEIIFQMASPPSSCWGPLTKPTSLAIDRPSLLYATTAAALKRSQKPSASQPLTFREDFDPLQSEIVPRTPCPLWSPAGPLRSSVNSAMNQVKLPRTVPRAPSAMPSDTRRTSVPSSATTVVTTATV